MRRCTTYIPCTHIVCLYKRPAAVDGRTGGPFLGPRKICSPFLFLPKGEEIALSLRKTPTRLLLSFFMSPLVLAVAGPPPLPSCTHSSDLIRQSASESLRPSVFSTRCLRARSPPYHRRAPPRRRGSPPGRSCRPSSPGTGVGEEKEMCLRGKQASMKRSLQQHKYRIN